MCIFNGQAMVVHFVISPFRAFPNWLFFNKVKKPVFTAVFDGLKNLKKKRKKKKKKKKNRGIHHQLPKASGKKMNSLSSKKQTTKKKKKKKKKEEQYICMNYMNRFFFFFFSKIKHGDTRHLTSASNKDKENPKKMRLSAAM